MPPESHSPRNKHFEAESKTFKVQLFRKLNLVFIFITVISACVSLSESSETGKSLFDSLPLNGAFALDKPENVEDQIPLASVPSIKTNELYEELPDFTNSARSSDDKSNTDSGQNGSSSSLFDLLPNQGALISSSSPPSSQTTIRKGGSSQGTSNDTLDQQNSRTQRHSNSIYSLQPPAPPNTRVQNGHFEIEKQSPKSEFSFSVFDSDDLPPIVKSLTAQHEITVPRVEYGLPSSIHRAIPIIQSSVNQYGSQKATGGGYSNNKGSSNLQPAQPVIIRELHTASYQDKTTNAFRIPAQAQQSHYKKPSVGATATSGGPTVIIYAHPTSSKGQNQNQNEHGPPSPPHSLPPDTSYGVPATQAPVPVATTVAPGTKNEIHYHYHINENKENKPEQPSVSYGTPAGPPVPPPRRYGVPGRRPRPLRRHFRGKQHNQNGYRNYSPPPKASEPSGGYDNAPKTSDIHEDFRTSYTSSSSQDDFNANEANQAQDDNTKSKDEDSQNREENFKQRTLLTYGKYQEQSQPSTSYNVPPQTSYGPPPVSYSTYGQTEQTTSPPAPQEVNDQNPSFQAQNAQTSITLETIPITTTETRLVTVPKITQTVGAIQNIPTLADTPLQPPPSSAYGAPYSRANSFPNGPPAPPSAHQNTRNILNEQLLQLSPSRGGLPDFSDIEALGILQNQNSQRSNNPLLSALLLEQLSNSNSNSQFSRGSSDLLLNSRNPFAGLNDQGQINLRNLVSSGGISLNNVPLLGTRNAFPDNSGGGLSQLGGSLRGGSTVLTGDAIGAISDLIREQRLQLAVSELRSRLKHQNRDAERNRQSYRSLFYKGALLLAGLSLIPAVATVASPLAAGAGLGLSTSSLLPLTAGRRKRSLHSHNDNVSDNIFSPYSYSATDTLTDRIQYSEFSAKHYPLVVKAKRKSPTQSLVYRNVKDNSRKSSGRAESNDSDSVFNFMAFKGALIPEKIRADLEKYVPPSQVIANSECIQRDFCSTLLEIEALPDPSSFLLLFSALASDIDKNPWLEHAMVAAKKRRCTSFTCRVTHN